MDYTITVTKDTTMTKWVFLHPEIVSKTENRLLVMCALILVITGRYGFCRYMIHCDNFISNEIDLHLKE